MNIGVPVFLVSDSPSWTGCAQPKSIARSQVPGCNLQHQRTDRILVFFSAR